MANGTDTFTAIKGILEKDKLSDGDAHRLLLAGIIDLNDKLDKIVSDSVIKEKEQKTINEKVTKMWGFYKVNVWLYGAIILGIIGLFFDFVKITMG